MNDMPYPNGRWTPNQDSIRVAAHSQRIPLFAHPAGMLLQVPLRNLFWGLPESKLVEEARQRVEKVVALALSREASVAQVELALA
jgi:hypothetical protein